MTKKERETIMTVLNDIREPSDEMIKSGARVQAGPDWIRRDPLGTVRVIIEIWQRMIDAKKAELFQAKTQ